MFDTTNFQPLLARRYPLEVRQQMAWYWQAQVIALAPLDTAAQGSATR